MQKRDISAAGAQGVVSMTLKTLRNDASFHLIWLKATKIANKLGVEEPKPPFWCKTSRRLEQGMHHLNFLVQKKIIIGEYTLKL